MTERLQIDWTRCDGRGGCAELLPEVLGLDDWGYPVPLTGEKSPEVPVQVRAHARRAVRDCPLMALRLVTDR